MPRVVVPLAVGFEEIEAITLIDILRRAGIEVVTAFLDDPSVIGSHQIEVKADASINTIQADDFDAMVLPGGMPGSENLKNDERVIRLLQDFNQKGKDTAAVCAAPIVLAQAELLEGKKATSFPGYKAQLGQVHYKEDRVVEDGTVVTSRGPGTAAYLAFTLVKRLVGEEKAKQIQNAMLYAL